MQESYAMRAPQMSHLQSKENLIKSLQGNSTKAYKRKKLKHLPVLEPTPNVLELTSAEMEIDESEGKF